MKKIVLLVFVLVLLSTAVVVGFIRPAVAQGTIYIRSDGSVDPPTTPISSFDNNTYTFTGNIYDSIVVERDNIVVDGASYALQGTGSGTGIDLNGRSNITIKNMKIKEFDYGIYLYKSSGHNCILGNTITNNDDNGVVLLYSSSNSISANTITNNDHGMYLYESSNNSLSGNNVTNNRWDGIQFYSSSFNWVFANIITINKGGVRLLAFSNNNTISGNNIEDNEDGTRLWKSSNNIISENSIITNKYGIGLWDSSNNFIYHNNFVDNTKQLYIYNSTNVWDDGYPSGGNYWSNYTGVDSDHDGIGDTPYIINEKNQDNYPLMSLWGLEEVPFWMQWWFWTIIAIVIVALAGTVYFLKKRKPPIPTATPPPTEGTLQDFHCTCSCHSHL